MTEADVFSFRVTESGRYYFTITDNCGAYDKITYDQEYGKPNPIGAFIDPFPDRNGDYKGGTFFVDIDVLDGEESATYEFYLASWGDQTVTVECKREIF